MRILVTGAAGFVGFHLAKSLLEDGHDVTSYDALTDYYDVSLKEARLNVLSHFPQFRRIDGLMEDEALLSRTVAELQPELVFHLAAQAGVRYSIEHPGRYISSNVVGSYSLMESLRNHPPKHLLMASTSSIYGGNLKSPTSELDTIAAPMSLYAATKSSMESIGHSYSHLYNIPVTCFRFFTVYGPWGRPDMALFKFVKAGFEGSTIEVYGQGKMERDFTFISDLVSAVRSLSSLPPAVGQQYGEQDSLSPVAPFRVVNIGGGKPVSVMEFISVIEKLLGFEINKKLLAMQAGDVVHTHADNQLLLDLIGSVPATELLDGVKAFVEWYVEHYRPAGVTRI